MSLYAVGDKVKINCPKELAHNRIATVSKVMTYNEGTDHYYYVDLPTGLPQWFHPEELTPYQKGV